MDGMVVGGLWSVDDKANNYLRYLGRWEMEDGPGHLELGRSLAACFFRWADQTGGRCLVRCGPVGFRQPAQLTSCSALQAVSVPAPVAESKRVPRQLPGC